MGKYLVKATFVLTILCLALGSVSIVTAQDGDEEEFMLEEITVTAQKREENQQKVAIAMEVVSGEDLVSTGKNDIDEILKDMANVEINQAATGMRVSIRGLVDDSGTSNDMDIQGSMVAVNIDGAYNSMSSAGMGLFDVERVEVLMGPQSTMYGANSPGGIVNVVTAAPKTDKYSGSASLEYGSFDLLNLQAAVNVPVIQDTVALRLAANNTRQGSWVEGDPASKSTAIRLKALWEANEDLDVSVTGNWSKKNAGGMMGGAVEPFVNQDDVDDPWTASSDTSSLANKDDQITKGLSADISWSLPFGNLAIVPSYAESSSEGDHTVTETTPWGTTETSSYNEEKKNEQKGGEIRMTNPESFEWFDWIVGGTWYDSYQYQMKDYVDSSASDRGREVWTNKKALYANITYPTWFNEDLRLTLGYRQSWDENNSYEYGGMSGTQGDPDTFSKPDMKYGFEYDAADNMMLYGSYASSYRSSNAVAMVLGDGTYPPNEELDAYTLGLKSRWLDNRLQVNLSVYYYDYSNKLASGYKEAYVTEDQVYEEDTISAYEGEPGRPNDGYTEETDGEYPTIDIYDYDEDGDTTDDLIFHLTDPNAQGWGAFSSLGIDLSTTWVITSRDRLNFSIAYLKAEWETLHFSYYYSDIFPDEDYAGMTPANSPELTLTANYEHNFALGALGTLTPRIDGKYKSEYHTLGQWKDYLEDYIYTVQEAYTMWDASVAFQHSSGVWSLNAYVKNITNYAVRTQVRVTDMTTEMRIGDPRTYGATLSIKF